MPLDRQYTKAIPRVIVDKILHNQVMFRRKRICVAISPDQPHRVVR
jgi:hypothetical protein